MGLFRSCLYGAAVEIVLDGVSRRRLTERCAACLRGFPFTDARFLWWFVGSFISSVVSCFLLLYDRGHSGARDRRDGFFDIRCIWR